MSAGETLAREVRAMAEAAHRIADELAEYADALAADESLEARLGDQYAGAPTMVQLLTEVAHRSRQPSNDAWLRAMADAMATAQRNA